MTAGTTGARSGRAAETRDKVVGVTPFGWPAAALTVAIERAGGLGVLDLGRDRDRDRALAALADVCRWRQGAFGVRIAAGCEIRPADLPDAVDTVLIDAPLLVETEGLDAYRAPGRRLLVEVVDAAEATMAIRCGASGIIARGWEAGGRVGALTTFVLLQRVLADPEITVPVWAAGGIGPHSAAAAVAGGARGVVLDSQLALVREMELPSEVAAAIAAMDGSETTVMSGYRVYTRPDLPAADPAGVVARLGIAGLRTQMLPVGQDGAAARPLAERYKTAGGVVQAIRAEIDAHITAAVRATPLATADKPEGRTYPVVQGPMIGVSDRATFAAAVAQDGGLPFLALALMSGEEVRRLLTDTAERLGDRGWGVGLVGYAPPEVRAEQLAVVRAFRPPYALLAGGRPGQAAALEASGITTYLHVPAPGLLEQFLAEGARRFVFEGMECGGHVGPRAAFPLWDAQVERLTAFADTHGAEGLSVLFAGGVHDERSAAMVAALAGPLAERGADIRVLMGTAYLFTHEAVAAGAILRGFQRAAIECADTALLETSPGHAARCARTPYVTTFEEVRRDLERSGTPRQEMWARLEELNLGRLRIASKGLRREAEEVGGAGRGGRRGRLVGETWSGKHGHLTLVGDEEQRREGMYMIGQVAALRSAASSVVELHEQVTTGATGFLAARAAALELCEPAETGRAPRPAPLDIAIVGMACVFPGAGDATRYWANIVGGVDSVTEAPADRWRPETYRDPAGAAGTTTSTWGGFLPDVPFDALAHGIPPGALGGIEPAQLLALEVAVRALADAGYAERDFDRSRTAVIFGAAAGTDLGAAYSVRAQPPAYYREVPPGLDEQLPRTTEDSCPGVLTDGIAGRIANRLNLGGAGYAVDAGCAASLAALDAAGKELAAGTSDMVLCGGVGSPGGIDDYLLFSSAPALSPSGRCAAFDAAADGIAFGEGVACVVLKRLADAEWDGDRIYAVIKSVAGSSDGQPGGPTAPRAAGQRLALERAYGRAGVSPAQAGLVEAHGTGTGAGDRTELTTLTEVFAAAGADRQGCTLGSVKSQIGHTKSAAGLAGLIKVAYALHTGVRPGTLHLTRPTAAWDPETSPFAFGQAARPWPVPPGARYAGVSGFGFGGANFHAVLSGYGGAPEPVSGVAEWPAELFLVRGAERADALRELDRLDELCRVNDRAGRPWRLRDLARTVADGAGPVRIALVATGLDDLAAKLAAAREFRAVAGVFPARRRAEENAKVAVLFPGQGSERSGMLAGLFVAFPRLQRLLLAGEGRYAAAMFPPAAFSPEEAERQRAAIADTRMAQPALGLADLAMHRLLTAVGVRPDMAAGHGYGELVALCAAGVYDERDLIAFSAVRAAAILNAAGEEPGAMAAVAAAAPEVQSALAGHSVVIAGHNGPRQTVISGPADALDAALAALAGRGMPAMRLSVAAAFHSPLVAGAARGLRADLDERELRPPAFPVWSNSTAEPYPADVEGVRATLAGQVAAPVRFVEQIEAMYASGARVFIEAGPGPVLTELVGGILGDRPHTAVACDEPGPVRGGQEGDTLPGLRRLLLALAELAAAGVAVDAVPLFAGRDARRVSAADAPARPHWLVNGHLVRATDGSCLDGAVRPAEQVAAAPVAGSERDAAVLEYLRNTRDLAAAQRDVVLGYLAGAPTAAPPSIPPTAPPTAPPTTPPTAPPTTPPPVSPPAPPTPSAEPVPQPRPAMNGHQDSAAEPAKPSLTEQRPSPPRPGT